MISRSRVYSQVKKLKNLLALESRRLLHNFRCDVVDVFIEQTTMKITNNLTDQEDFGQSQARELIDGLAIIPQHWALTPVDGSKRPYRKDWQKEQPLSRDAIASELKGRAEGFGIRTGEVSDGIIAIDEDGFAAAELAQELSDGDLPETTAFTSGRPGRRQLLYKVPQEYWGIFKTIKLKTGVKDEDGKEQQLEFRWNGCQSVLPPSVHPITGRYTWLNHSQPAPCPTWLVEFMLNHNQSASVPSSASSTQVNRTQRVNASGRPPLEIFLGRNDKELVNSGTGDGGRNDAAQKLSLNLIATARRLTELGIEYDGDPHTLYYQFCDRCSPPLGKEGDNWWRKADIHAKQPSLDDNKLQGCYKAWLNRNKVKSSTSTNNHLGRKVHCHGDNGLLSPHPVTIESDAESKIQAIVTIVTATLDQFLGDILERSELDNIYSQYKDSISRKLFDQIVASCRVKVSEVLPEDELRLKNLVEYSQTQINWDEVLPAPLARDLKHDADVLNIDPVMIWQALLAATSSLAGRFRLNEYGGVPAINWTCSVLASGGGKSRADNLVLTPLRKMQLEANTEYDEKMKEYKRELKEYEKNNDNNADEPTEPELRKHLFEVATIQSILKRLAGQSGQGSLWARDEIKGLFGSLNQFSKGDTEAEELLLSLWDDKPVFVDRVDIANSYTIARTALSVTGGIQDTVFRKAFRDECDGNGLQARFLFAVPQMRKKKYCKGYCKLSDRLPSLYKWLDGVNNVAEVVQLEPNAQDYFAKLVNSIGDQIEEISHPGIRTWMNKVDTHILRIALALHLLECYYNPNSKDIKTLTLDTLKRAVAFAQYYRSAFTILQEKVSASDDIASILLQIHSEALLKHPDGITARDVYRKKHILQRAKAAGREPSAYAVDLFEKMTELGYGQIIRKGRSVRFIANQIQNNIKPSGDGDNGDNNSQEYTEQESRLSPDPVTISHCHGDNQKNTDIRTGGEFETEQQETGSDLVKSEVPREVPSTPDYSKGLLDDFSVKRSQLIGDWSRVNSDPAWDDGSAFPNSNLGEY